MVPADAVRHGGSLLLSRVVSRQTPPSIEVEEVVPELPGYGWHGYLFLVLYALLFLVLFGWGILLLGRLMNQFRHLKDGEDRHRMTFNKFISYRFEYWFSANDDSNAIVLGSVAMGTLLLGSMLYSITVGTQLSTSTWGTFVQLVAPDAGVDEETFMGRFNCGFMSVLGLVIFALLLTLLQDSFTSWMASHRLGITQVIETGHIVLIGLQENAFPIIQELCMCYEDGITIVILATEMTKEQMDMKIAEYLPDLDTRGSKIVVRAGGRYSQASLRHVAADTAQVVAIFPDFSIVKEMRDASVLRTLVALRGSGWPLQGRILCTCSLQRNKDLLAQAGGKVTNVVTMQLFIAQLMVQASRAWGLGRVIHQTFGWNGVKFCITPVPTHLVGKPMHEAKFYFKYSVLVGVYNMNSTADGDIQNHTCSLNPGSEYLLKDTDNVVVLASDLPSAHSHEAPYTTVPACPQGALHDGSSVKSELKKAASAAKAETIVFFGWNDMIGRMIFELDVRVSAGTRVVIVSPCDVNQRMAHLEKEAKRFALTLVNIALITHVNGMLGSRFVIEELPVSLEQCDRIFLLADEDAPSLEYGDTCTIAAIMQVRDAVIEKRQKAAEGGATPTILNGQGHGTIVPELRTPDAKEHCLRIHASDYIDTAGLVSQILGMAAFDPRVLNVLEHILSERGDVKFAIMRLDDVTDEDLSEVDFCQVQGMAAAKGFGVVIGWSDRTEVEKVKQGSQEFHDTMFQVLRQSNPDAVDARFELNPTDKLSKRPWDMQNHRLLLLKPRGTREAGVPAVGTTATALGAEQKVFNP